LTAALKDNPDLFMGVLSGVLKFGQEVFSPNLTI